MTQHAAKTSNDDGSGTEAGEFPMPSLNENEYSSPNETDGSIEKNGSMEALISPNA
jgi:hypothetical protein